MMAPTTSKQRSNPRTSTPTQPSRPTTPVDTGMRLRTRMLNNGTYATVTPGSDSSANHDRAQDTETGQLANQNQELGNETDASSNEGEEDGGMVPELFHEAFEEEQDDQANMTMEMGVKDILMVQPKGVIKLRERYIAAKAPRPKVILNGKNFLLWSMSVSGALKAMKLWHVIYAKPEQIPTDPEQRDLFNDGLLKAREFIRDSLSDDLRTSYQEFMHPKKLLKALKGAYNATSWVQIAHLKKKLELQSLNAYEETPSYLVKVRGIYMELLNCGYRMSFESLKTTILVRMGQHWEYYIGHLKDIQSWDKFVAIVQEEVTRRLTQREFTGGNSATAFAATEKPTKYSGNKRKGGKPQNKDKKRQRTCFVCDQPGHIKKDCPYKPAIAKAKLAKAEEETADQATEDEEEVFFGGMVKVEASGVNDRSRWMVDSGASAHMCCQKDWFLELVQPTKYAMVTVASGKRLPVKGKGVIVVEQDGRRVELKDVLFVPELTTNLFSIPQASPELDVLFKGSNCLLYRHNELILTAKKSYDDLYVLRVDIVTERPSYALAVVGDSPSNSARLLHCRLGHLNDADTKKLIKQSIGLQSFKGFESSGDCNECAQGKMTRTSFNKELTKATRIEFNSKRNLKLFMDYWGPARQPTQGNKTGFVVFVTMPFHLTCVRLTTGKSGDELLQHLIDVIQYLEKQTGRVVTHLKSDGANEFIHGPIASYCRSRGIQQSHTAAYSPQQNGKAERMNRTLVSTARTMLLHANLPERYWGYAVETACFLRNRVPTAALGGNTPFHSATKKLPNLSRLRVFGCRASVHVPSVHRNGKFDRVAVPGVFLGYALASTCYLFELEDGRVVQSNDAIFYEEYRGLDHASPTIISPPPLAAVGDDERAEDNDTQQVPTTEAVGATEGSSEPVGAASSARLPSTCRRSMRSTKGQTGKRYEDYICYAANPTNDVYVEPQTFKQAMRSAESPFWRQAMNEELDALKENKVYEEMQELPKGVKPLPTKWVYKRKTKKDGTFKYKARLVVRGDLQREGIDYEKTFSPVIKFSTVRSMLALAVQLNLRIKVADIMTAFQNSPLEEDVWVLIGKLLAVLKRVLYGLKQASLAWYNALTVEG